MEKKKCSGRQGKILLLYFKNLENRGTTKFIKEESRK
jgi:hypothetical protein